MKTIILIALCFAGLSVQAQWNPITTQQELNDLGNAGYSWYYETLVITTEQGQDSSTMITDLTPLSVLDSIAGDLLIFGTALTNLDGLENLNRVNDIEILGNDLLEDIGALNTTLKANTIKVSGNSNLIELPDFSNVQEINGIRVFDNSSLENVDIRLTGVNQAGFELKVESNTSLSSIKLYSSTNIDNIEVNLNENLDSIHVSGPFTNEVFIRCVNNESLTTITGFQELTALPDFMISLNQELANLCFLQPFINDLTDDPDVLNIILTGNATGANSKSEILATDCSDFNTSVSELGTNAAVLYPNPASQWVEVKGNTPTENITLYTVSGQLVKTIPLTQSRFNVSDLPKGMYLVKTANEVHKLLVE